jgi:hypothetical protein
MAWDITGNPGTNPNPPSNNFLGTTDNEPLAIRTNNTERVRIDSSGNVWIGTTSPAEALHVYQDVDDIFRVQNTQRSWGIGIGKGQTPGSFFIADYNALARRLTIDNSGRVGIGTTTPAEMLDVAGAIRTSSGMLFADGTLQTTATARGPAGPPGPQGPPGVSPPPQVILARDTAGGGVVEFLGPSGRQTTHLGGLAAAPDNGSIAVTDLAGATGAVAKAWMYVDPTNGQGTISADVKNFRVPNPNQPNTDIVYACIEGPEAAAYVRGTAHLVNGQATVSLPDHFVSVIGAEGMTVQITPLSADSLGLAVIAKRPSEIVIKELHSGTGTYDFDWEVKGARKGHENYRVIRPSNEIALPRPE